MPHLEIISNFLGAFGLGKRVKAPFIAICMVITIAHSTQGQQPNRALFAGFSTWQYSGSYQGPNSPSAGFFVGFKTNKARYFNTRLEIGYGKAQGQSNNFANLYGNNGPTPSFQTDIFYGGLDLNFNCYKSERFTIYLLAGIGVIRFEPRDGTGETLVNLNPTRMQGELYGQSALWVPLGVGINYWVPNGPGLGLQLSYQNPGTAYLDNVNQYANTQDQLLAGKFTIYIPLKASEPRPEIKSKRKKRLNR